MPDSRRASVADTTAVAEYKRVLQDVLYNRPSGTRQRLAEALDKKASFISQITNPAYSVPIPAQHVEQIFELCHFAPPERARFLEAYARAHPRSAVFAKRGARWREAVLRVPDLHDARSNRHADDFLAEMALRLGRMLLNAEPRARPIEEHRMKKFLNTVDSMLHESLRGFAHAHHDIVTADDAFRFIRRTVLAPGKVALVSGGGSGHEPLHLGFVGYGMLDAACPGQMFTSPTPDQMIAAAEAVDTGAGVLFIVKNYEGDVMNFSMAAEMLGDRAATVVTDDDVAVETSSFSTGRRGVAGTLVVEKVLGAAAERGDALPQLQSLGAHVNAVTRTMGVALTSCTVPAVGRPTFDLGDDEMEMGVGIHGEPGRRRVSLLRADEIANELVSAVLDDLQAKAGSEVLLLLNGFGATPASELYLMYDAARRRLAQHGIEVGRSLVGDFVTSLDMAGCSITVTVLDETIASLWDAPVHTAALRWGR